MTYLIMCFYGKKKVNEPSKKSYRDDALFKFIKASFIKMQENAYIEKSMKKKKQSGVCDNPVWYLP